MSYEPDFYSTTEPATASNNIDFPDPAAVPIDGAPGQVQLYGTAADGKGTIATATWQSGTTTMSPTPAFSNAGQPLQDFLPAVADGADWAPAVRYLNGRYVMWFSARVKGRECHCLVRATSSTAAGPFIVPDNQKGRSYFCDDDSFVRGSDSPEPDKVGLFDPSIFVDPPSGRVRLLWSRQWGAGNIFGDIDLTDPTGAGKSEIVSMELNDDGSVPIIGWPTSVVTYTQMAQQLRLADSFPKMGSHAVIENPQLIYNLPSSAQGGTYALAVSFGTWRDPESYHTILARRWAIPVFGPSGVLAPVVLDPYLVSTESLDNPGGLSLLTYNQADNRAFCAATRDLVTRPAFSQLLRFSDLNHPIYPVSGSMESYGISGSIESELVNGSAWLSSPLSEGPVSMHLVPPDYPSIGPVAR